MILDEMLKKLEEMKAQYGGKVGVGARMDADLMSGPVTRVVAEKSKDNGVLIYMYCEDD
jgi:hypothetical protein